MPPAPGGRALPLTPLLAGQPSFYAITQLFLFRQGRRDNAAMLAVAKDGEEANGMKLPPRASATPEPLSLAAGEEAEGTTVLLVGRGSTIARANADLYATARLFQERGPYPAVEVCFVSLAPPCVFAGLRRCAALGARRVLVVPYFVNTGLLVRRIASQIAAARLFYPATGRCRRALRPRPPPDRRADRPGAGGLARAVGGTRPTDGGRTAGAAPYAVTTAVGFRGDRVGIQPPGLGSGFR